MNTVTRIEQAFGQSPEDEPRKLAEWFGAKRFAVESSAVLGSLYDDEGRGESQLPEA